MFSLLKEKFFLVCLESRFKQKQIFKQSNFLHIYIYISIILLNWFIFLYSILFCSSSKNEYREEKSRRSSKDYQSTVLEQETSSSHHRDVFCLEENINNSLLWINLFLSFFFNFIWIDLSNRKQNPIGQSLNIVVRQIKLMKMQ